MSFTSHRDQPPSLLPLREAEDFSGGDDDAPASTNYNGGHFKKPFSGAPNIVPTFQVKARKRALEALKKWETMRLENSRGGAGASGKRALILKHRAKYVRQTTAASSTRIAKHAVNLLNPPAYACELPSINGGKSNSVSLYSPRSFDRPARTPFVEPPRKPRQERVSTPEFKAYMDLTLGAEAPLMWKTIKAAKKSYSKSWGGDVRGQTRNLAYRYLRYIHGSDEFSDEAIREYMRRRKEEEMQKDMQAVKHENVLAKVIREALDKEKVAEIEFNKEFITEEQIKLIMLKAASSNDQLELFWLLLDEVVEEFLYDNDVRQAKKIVEVSNCEWDQNQFQPSPRGCRLLSSRRSCGLS